MQPGAGRTRYALRLSTPAYTKRQFPTRPCQVDVARTVLPVEPVALTGGFEINAVDLDRPGTRPAIGSDVMSSPWRCYPGLQGGDQLDVRAVGESEQRHVSDPIGVRTTVVGCHSRPRERVHQRIEVGGGDGHVIDSQRHGRLKSVSANIRRTHTSGSTGKRMGQWIESIRGIVGPEACDVNNHMNVRGYFEQFGEASGYLLKRVGLYYSDVVKIGYGMGTVVNTIRYRSELVDGDPYVIQSAFVRLGRSSIRYVHKMINETSGELSASSDSTEALFSLEARASVPLTDKMRTEVEAMLVTLSPEDTDWFG